MKKNRITVEQMSAIYKMAKAIYNEEERLVNGKENFFLVMALTKTLSQIFIEHFRKCLMENYIQEG